MSNTTPAYDDTEVRARLGALEAGQVTAVLDQSTDPPTVTLSRVLTISRVTNRNSMNEREAARFNQQGGF